MPQGGLSDAQLKTLLADPRLTAADIALLTPEEKASVARIKQIGGDADRAPNAIETMGTGVKDLAIGAAKGVGSTVTALGDLARKVPGVSSLDKVMAPIEFSTTPTNTAQSIGKGAEQIGEFLIPAGMARKAAIEGLVRLIPDAASPGTMKVLNKAGAVIGRTVGEMASAGAVSELHDDPNAGTTAMIAGAGPLIGSAASAAAPVIQNPMAQSVLATLAAVLGGKAFGPSGGVGAGLGTYSLMRGAAKQMVSQPGATRAIRRVAFKGAPIAARTAAGISSESGRE